MMEHFISHHWVQVSYVATCVIWFLLMLHERWYVRKEGGDITKASRRVLLAPVAPFILVGMLLYVIGRGLVRLVKDALPSKKGYDPSETDRRIEEMEKELGLVEEEKSPALKSLYEQAHIVRYRERGCKCSLCRVVEDYSRFPD